MLYKLKKEGIKQFLKSIKTDKLPHVKSKSLYDHLVRVSSILESWGLEEEVVFAGLCHSLYSTEFFETEVVSIEDREKLKVLLGEKAEDLVFLISQIERETLEIGSNKMFTFKNRNEQSYISVNESKTRDLLHILFANDLDHMQISNIGSFSAFVSSRYKRWNYLFCEAAQAELLNFILPTVDDTMSVIRFIAHAGIQFKYKESSLVIDPWVYSSTRQKPIIQGLDPENYTIDYLIPEPRNTISDIASEVVLLSHLHTHHSPVLEIKELLKIRPINLVCPKIDQAKIETIKNLIGEELMGRLTFHFLEDDTELELCGYKIRAFTHSHKEHFAFFVSRGNTSIMHMADTTTDRKFNSMKFEEFWEKFYNLKPDYLFISAAGHSQRIMNEYGKRDILEVCTLTPVLAAKAAVKIKPKNVGLIGMYNFSYWDNRMEYARSTGEAEAEFYWALSYLSPSINILNLKPGVFFEV